MNAPARRHDEALEIYKRSLLERVTRYADPRSAEEIESLLASVIAAAQAIGVSAGIKHEAHRRSVVAKQKRQEKYEREVRAVTNTNKEMK